MLSQPRKSSCPAPDVWREFAFGLLPLREQELLATHLSECTQCQSWLTESSHQDAPQWNALKRLVQRPPLPEETECSSLEKRACSIWTDEAGSDTVDSASADAEHARMPKNLGPY